jgi:hypothetical protein
MTHIDAVQLLSSQAASSMRTGAPTGNFWQTPAGELGPFGALGIVHHSTSMPMLPYLGHHILSIK